MLEDMLADLTDAQSHEAVAPAHHFDIITKPTPSQRRAFSLLSLSVDKCSQYESTVISAKQRKSRIYHTIQLMKFRLNYVGIPFRPGFDNHCLISAINAHTSPFSGRT